MLGPEIPNFPQIAPSPFTLSKVASEFWGFFFFSSWQGTPDTAPKVFIGLEMASPLKKKIFNESAHFCFQLTQKEKKARASPSPADERGREKNLFLLEIGCVTCPSPCGASLCIYSGQTLTLAGLWHQSCSAKKAPIHSLRFTSSDSFFLSFPFSFPLFLSLALFLSPPFRWLQPPPAESVLPLFHSIAAPQQKAASFHSSLPVHLSDSILSAPHLITMASTVSGRTNIIFIF